MWVRFLRYLAVIGMQFGLIALKRSYDTLLDIWNFIHPYLLFVLHQLHAGITCKKKCSKIQELV